jgi:hypothetical protein
MLPCAARGTAARDTAARRTPGAPPRTAPLPQSTAHPVALRSPWAA